MCRERRGRHTRARVPYAAASHVFVAHVRGDMVRPDCKQHDSPGVLWPLVVVFESQYQGADRAVRILHQAADLLAAGRRRRRNFGDGDAQKLAGGCALVHRQERRGPAVQNPASVRGGDDGPAVVHVELCKDGTLTGCVHIGSLLIYLFTGQRAQAEGGPS